MIYSFMLAYIAISAAMKTAPNTPALRLLREAAPVNAAGPVGVATVPLLLGTATVVRPEAADAGVVYAGAGVE